MAKLFVKTKTPSIIKIIPPIMLNVLINLGWAAKKAADLLVKRPTTKNGSIKPTEYAKSRLTPEVRDAVVPARTKIAAKTGPTQGVQPMAKADPTSTDERYPTDERTGNPA